MFQDLGKFDFYEFEQRIIMTKGAYRDLQRFSNLQSAADFWF